MKAFSALNRISLLILVIFLQACTSLQPNIELDKLTHPSQIKQFTVSGKIAFKTQANSKSATLYWRQDQQAYDIQLSTYLGIQVADIAGTPNQIEITADGKSYQSNAPEQLIAEQIGWQIPLMQLTNWVKGIHKGVVASYHPDGLPKQVIVRTSSSQEWQLTYLSYQSVGPIQLPKKIKCQTHNLTVILQINQWEQINQ
ncbi:lipoprotein insertase outer membrane protein LolB [Catenovulum sp. 2E275]|uniref:lipoprotein insertase outer membrane protein LolB n=1 Tax=Catenovulum sp. 2E275 TaxID=2980497 RepID=UPI0021CF9AD1|nr:lipoprotein insertase outer membrane protein LolB [Catenovulum sp. 2E275]MCU4675350.1 lipoprotein insertase outer membrane protein LolB [Catenovulum sp. 2E275]